MKTPMSLLCAILWIGYTPVSNSNETLQNQVNRYPALFQIDSVQYRYPDTFLDLQKTHTMLQQPYLHIPEMVTNNVLKTLKWMKSHQIPLNPVLTIIDYSRPSNEKRMWVFDLLNYQLLFNTYVSHGINSGERYTARFSNRNNSKSSSIGIYLTDKAYSGREGTSLRLKGLDRGFNDQAENRAIVMHGGWYMEDDFIRKYGRAGRSWGCPALPEFLSKSIIQTIANQSLMVVYYPDEKWLNNSPFLKDQSYSLMKLQNNPNPISYIEPISEHRGDVLFASIKIKQAETEPVLTVNAQIYEQIFKQKAPLERMLRRQLEDKEYIAINPIELNQIAQNPQYFEVLQFITPHLRMERGYYLTEMRPQYFGKITHITANSDKNYTIQFDNQATMQLKANDQFIRWIGL